MGIRVGIVGTTQGPSDYQARALKFYMSVSPKIDEVHHGDLIGVDEFVDDLAIRLGIPRVIHPPAAQKFRAFCDRKDRGKINHVYDPLPYPESAAAIVNAVDMLMACPLSAEPKGITGLTIRLARAKAKIDSKLAVIVIKREYQETGAGWVDAMPS